MISLNSAIKMASLVMKTCHDAAVLTTSPPRIMTRPPTRNHPYQLRGLPRPNTRKRQERLGKATLPWNQHSPEYPRSTTRDSWQQIEGNLASIPGASLPQRSFDGSVQEQLSQTHAHLFQECCEWAGTLRTVDMSIPVASAPGTMHIFAAYTTISARVAERDEALVALDNAS